MNSIQVGSLARRFGAMAVLPISAFALIILGTAGTALAQTFPHSLVASPDIYKVIAENAQYRVIEVTWQPGQRDVMHSHPASAVYYPMDCSIRGHAPNGATWDGLTTAGKAIVQMPIAAHMVENTGTKPCKVIMFEPR